MKILLVAHGLPPESVGGVEQHVEGLARALVDQGHDVTIYARSTRDGVQGTVSEEAAWGCRVVRVVYRHEGLTGLADLYRSELLDAAFKSFLRDCRLGFRTNLPERLRGSPANQLILVVQRFDQCRDCHLGFATDFPNGAQYEPGHTGVAPRKQQ